MNEMISQCPNCMTSFRVTEEQLDVAGGQVRCGYCMNVFMGREYLISGGKTDGLVDEDVLRSLIDPHQQSPGQQAAHSGTEFSDANALTKQEQELEQFDGISSGADFSYDAESVLGVSAKDALSDSLIEPERQLVDERLKFDEDDLRSSSDEDWALALLAELEDPATSSGSPDSRSDAQSDEWDPLQEPISKPVIEGSDNAPAQATKSGLGFEEIIFDSIPEFDDEPLPQSADEQLLGAPGETSSEIDQVEPIELVGLPEQSFEPEPELEFGQRAEQEQDQGVAAERGLSPEPNQWDAELVVGGEQALQSVAPPPESDTLIDPDQEPADVWGSMVEEIETDYSVPADGLKPDSEPIAPSSADEELSDEQLYEDASSVYASPSSSASEASLVSEMMLKTSSDDREVPSAEPDRRHQHAADFLPQHIDLEVQGAPAPSEPQPTPWNWIAGVAGMVLLIFLQYTYFYWGDLIASNKTRPLLASVCSAVGCELPPFRDLKNIEADQLVVRVHPEVEAALTVDIIIRIKSSLGQPFPVLQLTFSDMRNQAVASRKFFPNEYLDGEFRGEALMPSGSPIRLSLNVMDPGADATNYELTLLPTL